MADAEMVKQIADQIHGGHTTLGGLMAGGFVLVNGLGIAIIKMMRNLGKRLDQSHAAHVLVLEGQNTQLIARIVSLEEANKEMREEMISQAREQLEVATTNIERVTTATLTVTEASNRNERSNQSLADMLRTIHNSLGSIQGDIQQLRRNGG